MSKKIVARVRTYHCWVIGGTIFALLTACSIVLGYLLRDIDWDRLRQLGPLYLSLALGLSGISTALYTFAVYALLRSSGYDVTIARVYLLLTSSLSVNYVTPVKVGIPLRIYFYNHFLNIPPSTGIALVAIEALIGMLTTALAAIIGVAFLFTDIAISVPLTLVVVLLTGSGTLCYLPAAHLAWLVAPLPWRFSHKLTSFFEQVQTTIRHISLWALSIVTGLFVVNFAVHAVRLYFVLHVLGYHVSPVLLFFVLTVSVTAGNVSMLPMGLGVRDASFVFLLIQLGIPDEVALSVAVVQRLFTPGWPMLLGFISLSVLGMTASTYDDHLAEAISGQAFPDQT